MKSFQTTVGIRGNESILFQRIGARYTVSSKGNEKNICLVVKYRGKEIMVHFNYPFLNGILLYRDMFFSEKHQASAFSALFLFPFTGNLR